MGVLNNILITESTRDLITYLLINFGYTYIRNNKNMLLYNMYVL
jgi:hypothetical protein